VIFEQFCLNEFIKLSAKKLGWAKRFEKRLSSDTDLEKLMQGNSSCGKSSNIPKNYMKKYN
jgi:hypothetical protein